MQNTTRNIGYDCLKTLAAYAVVFQHILGFKIEGYNSWIYYGVSFAIPIFFMINGALILNRDNISLEYAGKKIVNILILVFLWNSLYAIAYLILRNEVQNPFWLTINALRQQGFFAVFWFLGALCFIYLTIPFWYEKLKNQKNAMKIVMVLCSVLVFIDGLSLIKSNGNLATFQISIPQPERIWTWFSYFCLGGLLSKPSVFKTICSKISVKLNFFLLLVLTVLVIIWDFIVANKIYHYPFLEYFYVNIFTILWSITIFIFFSRIQYRKTPFRIIGYLSKFNMGIYVIHWILVELSIPYLVNTKASHLLLAVVYSILSLLISNVLWRLPGTNRLLKL